MSPAVIPRALPACRCGGAVAVRFVAFALCLALGANAAQSETLDGIAERWVRLALSMGIQEEGYVDAYHGPAEWKTDAETQALTLEQIAAAATKVQDDLAAIALDGLAEIEMLRHRALTKHLSSLQARIAMRQGRQFRFDEESEALYDAVAPNHEPQYYQRILDQLDALLPGDGSVGERRNAFRELFIIPGDRLDAVFQAAIAECRQRTLKRIPLPEGEGFEVSYVQDKPWSAYNWYKGNSHSLIEVNTDLPIYIDRAIDLACHEGYPGHHVYNLLLDQQLYRKRGWVEFSILVLYGPQALLAEGTAEYGVDMTFPGNERIAFEKRVLFPLAGLDPTLAERYYAVEKLVAKLEFSNSDAARQYLDGNKDREQTIEYLMRYGLQTRERAHKYTTFMDKYRSYVISYTLGKKLVGDWIDGRASKPDQRWELFTKLLSTPYIPSQLR